MRIAILFLTDGGGITANKLKNKLKADVFGKNDFNDGLYKFTEEIFHKYDGFIFVMAVGIVVRSIAPLIKNKNIDPAVVVMDEKGMFAISLLSGHIGGANELASQVAVITGGTPVITTSTDINNVIAFDIFANENNCYIENISNLKYISSDIVNGKKVGLFLDYKCNENLPDYLSLNKSENNNVIISNKSKIINTGDGNYLLLRPRNIVIGIGCKKNTLKSDIEFAINDLLLKSNISIKSVLGMASIDLKKNEKGIIEYCDSNSIRFVTLSSEILSKVEHEFSVSSFVKKHTGAGSVAEACAVYGFKKAELICGKTVYKGITLALGELRRNLRFK